MIYFVSGLLVIFLILDPLLLLAIYKPEVGQLLWFRFVIGMISGLVAWLHILYAMEVGTFFSSIFAVAWSLLFFYLLADFTVKLIRHPEQD